MESDGWTLHEGQQKSDGTPVSVFVSKKPALVKVGLLQPALHHFTQCKKLRHPHILSVHATLDTDDPNSGSVESKAVAGAANVVTNSASSATTGDLIIVTEPCIPFDAWLKQGPPPEELAWGLEGVVRSLHFLHASANLSHCNVSPSSLFVTKAGDVKLWNFSLVTPVAGALHHVFIEFGNRITPRPYISPERLEQRWDAIQTLGAAHIMDSFSLGVLISDFYGGHIPGPLEKAVQRLQTPNINMRPRLQPLLKCPLFDTPYQKTQLQLLEFAVQPVESKIEFWKNLLPSLQAQLVPTQLAVFKILPLMKNSIQTICSSESIRSQELYRREVIMILPPMFYIAEHYLADNFAKQLTPTIALLFSINDRGIRGSLLKKVPLMVQHLDDSSLNSSVFEPMCSGFSDSSGALRELTLKATLSLVPHLTPPNLEKLSRYLVRLQNDEETSIRTNTVYFISKLAPNLTEITRQKLLLPAFVRAMKDPFTPCRLAALQSTLQAKHFFDPQGIASKVLPAVAPCCVDPAANVRKEAFTAVEELLYMLRQESERLSRLPDPTAEQGTTVTTTPATTTTSVVVPAGPTQGPIPTPPVKPAQPVKVAPAAPVAASPASGGYFSSWMSSTKKPVAAPAPLPPPPMPPASSPTLSFQAPIQQKPPAVMNLDDGWGNEDGTDGWGDDDHDNHQVPPKPVSKPLAMTTPMTSKPMVEDDFFADVFDNAAAAKPAVMVAPRKPASGKLKVPTVTAAPATAKKPIVKPAVQKLTMEEDKIVDGWDDF